MSLDRHSCRREHTQRSEPLANILTRRVLSGGSPTGSRVLPRAPAPFPVIAQVERSGHHAVANLASKGVRQPVAFGGKRTAELDAAPVDDAAQISLICPTLVRAGQFVAVGGDHQRMLCAAGAASAGCPGLWCGPADRWLGTGRTWVCDLLRFFGGRYSHATMQWLREFIARPPDVWLRWRASLFFSIDSKGQALRMLREVRLRDAPPSPARPRRRLRLA